PVLGVYSVNSSRTELSDLLRSNITSTEASTAPSSLPVSLLAEQSRPARVSLLSLVGRQSPGSSFNEEPITADHNASVEDRPENRQRELHAQTFETERNVPISKIDDVLVLPWSGPFEWAGLILASGFPSITAESLDPYREPLARLTDRLAVALEFQRDDATNDSFRLRASRTTNFSRSLISCLEQSQPLDAVVREVTKLVSSDSAALWRVDESTGMVRMVAAHGLTSPEFLPLPVGQGL